MRPFGALIPTRVGMARARGFPAHDGERFPHPRGDGPAALATQNAADVISPPAWGWPGERVRIQAAEADFPTRVGMGRAGHILEYDRLAELGAHALGHHAADGVGRSARLGEAYGIPGDVVQSQIHVGGRGPVRDAHVVFVCAGSGRLEAIKVSLVLHARLDGLAADDLAEVG